MADFIAPRLKQLKQELPMLIQKYKIILNIYNEIPVVQYAYLGGIG